MLKCPPSCCFYDKHTASRVKQKTIKLVLDNLVFVFSAKHAAIRRKSKDWLARNVQFLFYFVKNIIKIIKINVRFINIQVTCIIFVQKSQR
jgi:hypothetical protein